MNMIRIKIAVFMLFVLSSCDVHPKLDAAQVSDWAKRSDLVVLSDVDTGSGIVEHRVNHVIAGEDPGGNFTRGTLLPWDRNAVAPNTDYGDQRVYFLKKTGTNSYRYIANWIIRDGEVPHSSISVEALTNAIRKALR